jgi:hypothetical protein
MPVLQKLDMLTFDVSSFVQIEWLRDNEEEGLRIAVSFASRIPHLYICSLF